MNYIIDFISSPEFQNAVLAATPALTSIIGIIIVVATQIRKMTLTLDSFKKDETIKELKQEFAALKQAMNDEKVACNKMLECLTQITNSKEVSNAAASIRKNVQNASRTLSQNFNNLPIRKDVQKTCTSNEQENVQENVQKGEKNDTEV